MCFNLEICFGMASVNSEVEMDNQLSSPTKEATPEPEVMLKIPRDYSNFDLT